MIELLLAAERMLGAGDLDHAERLFSQVAEADPRNAIAVVGLAEVAVARAEPAAAAAHARRALEIDPENAAARRMLERAAAGLPTKTGAEPEADVTPLAGAAAAPEPLRETAPAVEPESAPPRRSWLDRLLGFLGRR